MRTRSGALAITVATGAVVAPLLAGAALAEGEDTATTGLQSDAWYTVPPTCALPTGCGDAAVPAPSAYPAKTLHVGATAGVEESRTYLKLDLTSVPFGAVLSGGTLTLPVAPEGDGSRAADTAALRACLVKAAFDPAAEGASPPPEIDCETAAPAKFAAGQFTVDLAPLATAWAGGKPQQGIAIVPAPTPGATFHVAFSAGDRDTDGATKPPSATVTFTLPTSQPVAAIDEPEPVDVGGTGVVAEVDPGVSFSGSSALGSEPAPIEAPPVTAPEETAPLPAAAAPVAVSQSLPAGFAYPAVFLVPLALLAGAGWLGRAFTRDLASRPA